jgi:hypothetical protein
MRTLIRGLLILILVVAAGFLLLGYWTGTSFGARSRSAPSMGTSGTIDTEKARERGAEIGEKSAIAAEKVKSGLAEAAVTGKIKTKMALDDTIKARSIDVTTTGTVVTVSGAVRSAAERNRVVALARETEGVSRVVDHLEVRP